MRRRISSPRILLLDCPLEYKKGENQTNVELTREEDWSVDLAETSLQAASMHSWVFASLHLRSAWICAV